MDPSLRHSDGPLLRTSRPRCPPPTPESVHLLAYNPFLGRSLWPLPATKKTTRGYLVQIKCPPLGTSQSKAEQRSCPGAVLCPWVLVVQDKISDSIICGLCKSRILNPLDESKKYLVQLLLLTLCDDSGSLSWGCSHIGVKEPEMNVRMRKSSVSKVICYFTCFFKKCIHNSVND